jgi:hypothetical protein
MSVGFGFSIGDFISALELVATVVDALRESGDSSTEYRALISQLYTLETALLRVKRLELDESQYAEVVALRQAAGQCQRTIDAFWERIKKYQPSLRSGGSGSRVRDGWRKIEWALCRKDDVVRFRSDLIAHTESIELLLTTVQMAATRINSKKNDEHHKSLVGKVQESYFGCMQRMTVVMERVSAGIHQGKQLLEMTAKVIQTNVKIFHIVLDIQNIVTRIPGQINRQQPVHFVDAIGRHTPFHLEFITSADSLITVLRNNFLEIGSGAFKIERGEFAIQDCHNQRDIDLKRPWGACFSPGQCVAMSMIFTSSKASDMHCPKCREDNGDEYAEDEDIECRNCSMVYRRSISWTTLEPLPSFSMKTAQITPSTGFSPPSKVTSRKRKRQQDEDEEMGIFRRVRIKTSIVLPSPSSRPSSPEAQPQHGPFGDSLFDPPQTSVKAKMKFIREAQRAKKKAQQTKIILARGEKGNEIRHVSPIAINFVGGMMSTFTSMDPKQPKPKPKRAPAGSGRLRKSKEQKQAEKDSAIAAQAAIDAGEEPPHLR